MIIERTIPRNEEKTRVYIPQRGPILDWLFRHGWELEEPEKETRLRHSVHGLEQVPVGFALLFEIEKDLLPRHESFISPSDADLAIIGRILEVDGGK